LQKSPVKETIFYSSLLVLFLGIESWIDFAFVEGMYFVVGIYLVVEIFFVVGIYFGYLLYGVASVSRIDKITGLFRRIQLLL